MSGKKKRKPPIDKTSIRERLEDALEHRRYARIRRWIPKADRVDGFVVGLGAKWVAVAQLSNQITLDGYAFLRLKDVQAVSLKPDFGSFVVKALTARGSWPAPDPGLALDDTVDLLQSIAARSPLLGVYDEFDQHDVCWIGAVTSVEKNKLQLLEIRSDARWERKASTFDPRDLTQIDFGTGYQDALRLVAGDSPRV